jgi:DNA-binding transcriptional LysR family regulator
VRATVQELGELTRGRVRLGMVAASGAFGVADLLAGFHHGHPGVEISLLQDESAALRAALVDGTLDLALLGTAGREPSSTARLARQIVVDDRLTAAVAPGHPLAARRAVSLRTVVEHPLMCVPRGTGMRTALEEGCAEIGVEPRITFEAADPLVLAQLAARGLGVAILPASSQGIEPSLVVVAITRPQMRSRIELAWRDDGPLGPAARALIDAARVFFANAPSTLSSSA